MGAIALAYASGVAFGVSGDSKVVATLTETRFEGSGRAPLSRSERQALGRLDEVVASNCG